MTFDLITFTLFLASAVRLAAPVILAALGEIVSERAGVFNIGLEGMMLTAAFAAVAGAAFSGSALGGLVWGALAGVASAAVLGLSWPCCGPIRWWRASASACCAWG